MGLLGKSIRTCPSLATSRTATASSPSTALGKAHDAFAVAQALKICGAEAAASECAPAWLC